MVRPSIRERRTARRLLYANGALWALGNGMVGSMLVVYLVMHYDIPGLATAVGLILASPRIAGLLRISTPVLVGNDRRLKSFCVACYGTSAIVLILALVLASPGVLPSALLSVTVLISGWALYHLLEYFGTAALWSWIAALVPLPIRGRFIGVRERWMQTAQACAMLVTAAFNLYWTQLFPAEAKWLAYVIPATLGGGFLALAVIPLLKVPAVVPAERQESYTLRQLLLPLRDRRFFPMLLFGCWFAVANGLTQTLQNMFPFKVLGIELFFLLALRTMMRLGQIWLGPHVGRLADRIGNKTVMAASIPLLSSALLFYLWADSDQPWLLSHTLVAGAWVAWIAWVGVNVAQPSLLLKVAPPRGNLPYVSCFYALCGATHAVSVVVGGMIFDRIRQQEFAIPLLGSLGSYDAAFLLGWLLRTASVIPLLLVTEKTGKAGSKV